VPSPTLPEDEKFQLRISSCQGLLFPFVQNGSGGTFYYNSVPEDFGDKDFYYETGARIFVYQRQCNIEN
jgi:hypothetical protein